MLKKLLAAVVVTLAASSSATAPEFYQPYIESHVNFLYNLLFCDDISLFKTGATEKDNDLWRMLLAVQPDTADLRKIANDETNEGRVRALAFNQLRAHGEAVPPKHLLGVVVEIPLEQGLDVLAAFSEGGVRYLNQSGKVVIFEGQGNPVEELAKELVAVSQPIINKIGPWDKNRLPPPKAGNIRISFLVSDGLYFGEGAFTLMQRDAMAGPVIAKATQLLQQVVKIGSN
jgi:hypothetical protein